MSPGDSDRALDASLSCLVARLRTRLVAGAAPYRDTSFARPAAELVGEIQEELEDIWGWSLLLWMRLERLRGAVEHLDGTGGTSG